MAKMNSYTGNEDPTTNSTVVDDRVTKYMQEFTTWRDDLKQYWPEIDKQQEMYEFYKREGSETGSDVSLNTAFSVIESLVSKSNDTTLEVTTKAKGMNGLDDFEEYISNIVKDAIEDQDVAAVKGSFRKIKEVYEREFFVKGNAVAEVQYLYKTSIVNGKKVTVADNPFTMVLNYKNYIYNPAQYFDASDIQYLEKYTTLEALKAQAKDDKAGKGMYENLDALEELVKAGGKNKDARDSQNISGDTKVKRKVQPIRLIERWEGAKLCVVASDKIIIREEYDPKKIGWSGIVPAMNYKIEGRPYAYGEIAVMYKPVRAQDTVLNQSIEMVNKYLRPSIFVKDTEADLDAIIEVMENGGVTYGDPSTMGSAQTNVPPSAAFQTIDTLQQGIERSVRYSPYSAGIPNQSSDKTAGTKGGIQALQSAAEPNFQVKLDTLQDSFMRPLARVYLRMIGNLMGETDLRYGFLRGKSNKWVKATKGILTGRATVQDLVTIEELPDTPESIAQLITEMGLDPNVTDPMKTIVFETEWLLDVRLDSKSAADKEAETQSQLATVQFGLGMGVKLSPERTFEYFAKKQGMDDVEELMLTPEEQQKMAQSQGPQDKPSVSISYRDLPPEGQVQAAAEAGIQLQPQQIVQDQMNQQAMSAPQPAMAGAPGGQASGLPGGF